MPVGVENTLPFQTSSPSIALTSILGRREANGPKIMKFSSTMASSLVARLRSTWCNHVIRVAAGLRYACCPADSAVKKRNNGASAFAFQATVRVSWRLLESREMAHLSPFGLL